VVDLGDRAGAGTNRVTMACKVQVFLGRGEESD
jgi:hypothetical protein